MIKLRAFAAKTDQGPYLQVNEDSYEVDLVNDLYMIFDGFGGSGIGDQCVAKLKEQIKTFYTRINGNPDATLPFYFSHKYLLEGNCLLNSMFYAHKNLCKDNQKLEMSKRAGASTLVGALSETIMTFASVGNCLCYLNRKGSMSKIFQEDNLRFLSRDAFQGHLQTAPMSAFGMFEDLHWEVREVKILPGDQFVFLTDGAYARVSPKEVKHFLDKGENTLAEKIESIFSLSNERGNFDNQSAVILQF